MANPDLLMQAIRKLLMSEWAVLVLEGWVAITAIPAGVMLIAKPDGSLLGMSPEIMSGSPFGSFLIPGLALALLVGGSAVAAFMAVLIRHTSARLFTFSSAVLLVGWIGIQVLIIGYQSLLQPFYLILGLLLCALTAFGRGWTLTRGD